MQKLILIGAGGFAKSVMDSVDTSNFELAGFIDCYNKESHLGFPVLGKNLDDIINPEKYVYFISIGNARHRQVHFKALKERDLELINVIDKTALVGTDVKFGTGCFVGKLVVVNRDVTIGDNCIINTKALLEHGCRIGSHVNISTCSILNGDVHVGNESFVGSGAIVNGQVKIGHQAVVGSGAVVVRNVGDKMTVVGVPARAIDELELSSFNYDENLETVKLMVRG